MPTFQSQTLLAELETTVIAGIEEIEPLLSYTEVELQQQPADGGWSVVEVLFHLNYYAQFYTNAMEEAMNSNTNKTSKDQFTSGWLGNYFTNIIGPRDENGELRMKMKSPSDAAPSTLSELEPKKELKTYLSHQRKLIKLLHQARYTDLGAIRVPISISKWVRLKLGDTFRFVVAHQQRHHQQIAALVKVPL